MKIQLMSDLHFEHRSVKSFAKSLDPSGVDVLVLAGDIAPLGFKGVAHEALGLLCQAYPSVVYVLGNHEYYGTGPDDARMHARQLEVAFPNLFILWPERPVTIHGQRFLGGTLWFEDSFSPAEYRREFSDFVAIRCFEPWVYQSNAEAQKAFCSARPDDIVVTHHLPSPKSTPDQFKGSALNRFFVCNCEDTILRRRPKLWLHGHTHEPCDYQLGETRVVCNPLGYPHEESGFNPRLIIDV